MNPTQEQEIFRKGGEVVESKPYRPTERNESKIPEDWNKDQASNPQRYRGNIPLNKPIPDPKSKTDFHGQSTDLEGYIFDLGPRASENFYQKMKDLD